MNRVNKDHTCLVCGWDKLEGPPYYQSGVPSFVCCESCGFEYGFDDIAAASGGDPSLTKEERMRDYREDWIKGGMKWWKQLDTWGAAKPDNWDPKKQLLNIGIKVE